MNDSTEEIDHGESEKDSQYDENKSEKDIARPMRIRKKVKNENKKEEKDSQKKNENQKEEKNDSQK